MFDEENIAADLEMAEVISKDAIIRAWRRLRQTLRQTSVLKDETWSRGSQPMVINKKTGDNT
jgi:hypothetical protein